MSLRNRPSRSFRRLGIVFRTLLLVGRVPKDKTKPSVHLAEPCFLPWPHFVFAKSPETNTTNTAAYAAVPAKIASRFALVVTLRPRAKKIMKVMTSARRALGSVTKYKTTMGQASRKAAMVMLRDVTTQERRWSLKCRNLSTSCGDRRCQGLAMARPSRSKSKMSNHLSRKWPIVSQKSRQRIFL
jgi:hypothetical protein